MTRAQWLRRNRALARFILAHPSFFPNTTAEIAERFLAFRGDENV